MSTIPRPDRVRVVVIGAGYAGLIATNRLLGSLTEDERRRTEVTVVNPRPVFVERVRLHQLVAGSRSTVTAPLAWLLHPDAEVLVGVARYVDAGDRTVHVATDAGQVELPYDLLVYAVGSVAAAPIPGAREHAHLVGDHDGAAAAAEAIGGLGAGQDAPPRVSVVGGGPTGIETAAELAERHPDAEVTLFCAGPLAGHMRPAARRTLRRALRRLGVRVEEHARVVEIEPGALRVESGEVHEHDVCIVAAAFEAPGLARTSGLPVDEAGRLQVDHHLRCLDDPRIIGAGDAVVAPERVAGHLRMACATALPLGAHAADTVLRLIRGTALREVSVGYVIQCLSLGRRNGYIQVVGRDDSPRRLHVGGRAGARIKEKICELVLDAPRRESTRPGAFSWPKGPRPKRAARRTKVSVPAVDRPGAVGAS